MPLIRCPVCRASGALCSTCNGKRFVEANHPTIDWRDTTETDADWKRVDNDIRKVETD